MRAGRWSLESFLFVVAVSLLAVSPAHAAVSCHKINAKGVGQDLGGGMTQAQIAVVGCSMEPRKATSSLRAGRRLSRPSQGR